MADTGDNPYAPPASDLDGERGAPDALTVVEEALVDYMAAMRPWVALFAGGSAAAAAAVGGWLCWRIVRSSAGAGAALGCAVALCTLAFAAAAMARYVAAAGTVIRSRRRRDLERALSRRRLSNVAGFVLLIGGIAFGTFALSAWL